MADYIDWPGKSGKLYRYWFLADATADGLKAEGGNYAFVKKLPTGNFVPLYFGETDNFKTRVPSHERWPDAKKAGFTHLMGHTTPAGEMARKAEEKDLIERWQPVMNVHHKKAS
jgi:hypothetical protein